MENSVTDIFKEKAGIGCIAVLVILMLLVPSRVCLASIFESGPKIQRGDAAASFVVRDIEGNRIDLNEHIGNKAILLDFWSIYCGPCVEEMPALIGMYEKYNDMGLEVFGISLDSKFNARRLGKFVESYEHEIPYPIIHDSTAEIRRLYGISTLPTAILVDTGGTVHLLFVGFSEAELEDAIKQVLDQSDQTVKR
jgi:peroxiredoxin